ncbi:urease accessory protein [Apiospora kogelbergensis]|uniref:urease accessory protein n=1 Tax=Apiospora kogelbergensis TaxID=1337665 RepID=UPI0031320C51
MSPQIRDEGADEDAARVEAEIADLEARLQSAKEPRAWNPTWPTNALPFARQANSHGRLLRPTSSPLSLSSYASTTLPFVLAAHRDPTAVADLDDQLDAAVICTVGRRASIAQGRALLGIWDRSFVSSSAAPSSSPASSASSTTAAAAEVLKPFSALLRSAGSSSSPSSSASSASATATATATGSDPQLPPPTAYVFLLSHVKALVSAAVRASLFGPYQAQRVLASPETQALITAFVAREWVTPPEDAGQSVPVMDLWIGRHEMLYSRIFNS